MLHTILLFLKIGKQKHIVDLYEKGVIYMNTFDYFRKVDKERFRGDNNEGAINVVDTPNATIKVPWLDKELKPLNIRYGKFLKSANLYSLYSISSRWCPNPNNFKFDKRNIDFGSHSLMIKEPGTFIERVENELIKRGYKFEHGFVKYYECKERLMNLSPFHKLNEYDYQNEFRFYVENEKNKPLIINIGSMKSYSEIVESKELPSIELKHRDN